MDNGLFTIENNVIKKCHSKSEKIVIPEGVNIIDDRAFECCTEMISIVVPEGVTRIGWHAFEGCKKLKSITIPSSVTIIQGLAFAKCTELTSITIPASVTTIGERVFAGCDRLSKISVETKNQSYHSEGNCIIKTKNKELIAGCNNSKIPTDGSVTIIGNGAFTGCMGLSNVSIPDSVTRIGSDAFTDCTNLMNIFIPNSVTEISHSAFKNCIGLTSIKIPDSVSHIGWYSFEGCTGLTTVVIPSATANIGISPFKACSGLNSIDVSPDNPKYHSDGNCLIETESKKLVSGCNCSRIPNDGSVTIIGEDAFNGINRLRCIEIPNSISLIDDGAFCNCMKLEEIAIPDSVTGIGDRVFESCIAIKSITVSENNKMFRSIDNCLIWTEKKALIVGCCTSRIPEDGSVTIIDEGAFAGCKGLSKIEIPDNIIEIRNSAFEDCCGLLKIEIPSSVKEIGYSAFEGCCGLLDIVIPDSVTEIGECVFKNCTSITNINFPNSITYIDQNAFEGCTSLTRIIVPENIASISDSAFEGCTSFKGITYRNNGKPVEEMFDKNNIKEYPDSLETLVLCFLYSLGLSYKKTRFGISIENTVELYLKIRENWKVDIVVDIWEEGDAEDLFEFEDNFLAANLKRLKLYSGAEYAIAVTRLNFQKYNKTQDSFFDCYNAFKTRIIDVLKDIDTLSFYTESDVTTLHIGSYNGDIIDIYEIAKIIGATL